MADIQDSPRTLAAKAGEKYYDTGKPCINGHLALRRTNNAKCMQCDRIRASARYYRFTENDHIRKRRNGRKYRLENLEKEMERGREYRSRNAEKMRARRLAAKEQRRAYLVRRMYGLSADRYAELMAVQGGGCAICRTALSDGKKRPHVDHDHATGVVRGLLCTKCNAGIGMLRDDAVIVRAALDYLESHAVKQMAA